MCPSRPKSAIAQLSSTPGPGAVFQCTGPVTNAGKGAGSSHTRRPGRMRGGGLDTDTSRDHNRPTASDSSGTESLRLHDGLAEGFTRGAGNECTK
eukprot:430780-Rhodomonas_salina.1